MTRGAYLMNLGLVGYQEAWDLQRSLAAAVTQGAIPDTVLFLEHPPTITLGRRTEDGEVHIPEGVDVDVVETDRGGKSTYHGPGQLVCYPILDLKRYGQDVKKYCRDLEEALIQTLASFELDATRIEGLTGVWLESPSGASGGPVASGGSGDSAVGTARRPERSERVERAPEPGSAGRKVRAAGGVGPRKIASIGIHITKWVTTHGYALNVDLDPAPFTEWITACGIEDAMFTSVARELGREVTVDEVRTRAAEAFADVFEITFEELPGDEPGLWAQPLHQQLAAR